jgi:DNA-binding NarL/FixJ family response regulator
MYIVTIISEVRLIREGLSRIVQNNPECVVLSADANIHEMGMSIQHKTPDIIIYDASSSHAVDDISRLSGFYPLIKIIAFGIAQKDDVICAYAEAGVDGFIFQEDNVDDLFATIRCVKNGQLRCSEQVANALLQRLKQRSVVNNPANVVLSLTPREKQIMELIALGLTNKQISKKLSIQLPTVKNHLHNIFEKLHVRTRSEAVNKIRHYYASIGKPVQSSSLT